MPLPVIRTAIPKRRYQVGPYQAVVLGEIESPDAARYHYLLALVRPGETKPDFFVSCEKNPRSRVAEGSHRLRVLSATHDEERGSSDAYANVDAFAEAALAEAAQVLGLAGLTPVRVM
jgi:hypothetical protein